MRRPRRDGIAWLDGVEIPVRDAAISVRDPAVLVGMGLFETVAVRDGHPLQAEAHFERLAGSAACLSLPLPPRHKLERTCREAAARERSPLAWLKILVTLDGRWVVFTGPMDADEEGASVAALTLPWRRDSRHPIAGLKTTSYALQQYGMDYARDRGAEEGLWRNSRGRLCEGCFSNLFVVKRGRLFTPAVREGILPGIVRATVLRVAREASLVVHEGRVRPERLKKADEAFLTSSLCGVRPLVVVDGRTVADGRVGPLTRRLSEQVSNARRRRTMVE